VGKTTLALQAAEKTPSIYLDLQREEQRKLLEHPERFLPRHRDKLVILDEIHHVPELFSHLRGFIDESRRRGKDAGQYLILGSAMQGLLRQTAESLTGRIAYPGCLTRSAETADPGDLRENSGCKSEGEAN